MRQLTDGFASVHSVKSKAVESLTVTVSVF